VRSHDCVSQETFIRKKILLFLTTHNSQLNSLTTDNPQLTTQLTASFNAFPALKSGTLAALISISAPVFGLRPLRAARFFT